MVKHLSIMRVGLAMTLALVLLVIMAQSAFAKVTWCDEDLGPMATRAEAQIADTPAGAIQGDHIVAVPIQAVSTAKGGTNAHK